jgi:DNA polymerase-3 subunit beta
MMEIDIMVDTAMKLTCSREDFVSRLGIVSRAVSTRSSVQILAGVLLRASRGELQLAATDMELSLRTSLDAQVEDDGSVVVPGRLLVDLARLLPDSEVQLEHRADEGVLGLVCGSASYRLHTYSAEDFPRLPEIDDTQIFTVDAEALLETVAQVSRSASRDESRPVLTGILARFEPGKLVMAATDSYRLAVKETDLAGSTRELEAIIPARALTELARIAGATTQLELGVQENQVAFRTDEAVLTTRRIDGQFPNVKQLLPEQFEHVVTLPRSELLDVVRRVSVMAQRNSPLRLRFSEGELEVSAQTQDVGEAKESLPAPFAGDALEIGFNPEFLRDGIESVQSDEIQLKLISPLRPGLIQGESDDYSYLIMPIRLAG